MKSNLKLMILNDENEKFFGEGPCRLFHLIGETGSLRSAAISMDMSYSKAFAMIKNAENALGFPITVRSIGGKKGGGSRLTPEAIKWLHRYEQYRNMCAGYCETLFHQYFDRPWSSAIGCVIMASGLGKRFGGNKLMAELNGKPLIGHVLDTVSGSFVNTVVVTRSTEVSSYAFSKGFLPVLHTFPGRNDTVRIGISSLPDDLTGCVFFMGDQPFLKKETVMNFCDFAAQHPDLIIRCSCGNAVSSPVYFPDWTFERLRSLPEGKG